MSMKQLVCAQGTNCAIRAKCDAVRAAVDAGNTEEAVRLAESVHPAIFEVGKVVRGSTVL